jgi:hypothetical protein
MAMRRSRRIHFRHAGAGSFSACKDFVFQAVEDDQLKEEFVLLVMLDDVDLYDMLDELWLDKPGTV